MKPQQHTSDFGEAGGNESFASPFQWISSASLILLSGSSKSGLKSLTIRKEQRKRKCVR
jgi:hypothetical protein